jgi:hypothetical protein
MPKYVPFGLLQRCSRSAAVAPVSHRDKRNDARFPGSIYDVIHLKGRDGVAGRLAYQLSIRHGRRERCLNEVAPLGSVEGISIDWSPCGVGKGAHLRGCLSARAIYASS